LLPALFEPLCSVVALTLGQLFLATRELVELLQRVVDVLRAPVSRGSGLLCLVLVLLSVELQIEQAREVAAGAAAASAAASSPKRHLDLPEGRLRAKQMLQRFLFVRDRVLPFLLLELQ